MVEKEAQETKHKIETGTEKMKEIKSKIRQQYDDHQQLAYKLHAVNGILFNHESPRRGSNFVTNKVVKGAVLIKKGLARNLELGNMDSFRDWGVFESYSILWI